MHNILTTIFVATFSMKLRWGQRTYQLDRVVCLGGGGELTDELGSTYVSV